MDAIAIKSETGDLKTFFIREATYNLMGIDRSEWSLICLEEATYHYVDARDLQLPDVSGIALD